jgi:hypothetical protein
MLSSVNAIVSLSIYCIYLMHSLHYILLDHYDYLMMQSCLWQMVHTRTTDDDVLDIPEGSAPCGRGRGQPSRGNAPPPPPHPPVSLEQLLATQNELMTLLIQNEARHGAERPQHPRYQNLNTSYSEFLVTHPPVFSGGKDPLEADNWLRTTKSKFSLLHCTEYQKTLYEAQQLRGSAGAWWASYPAALPADHQVPWTEFRTAFRGHHLSAGTMRRKLAEFLNLRQGNYSVYEYIQEFNNLAQYGSHHVDTDAKKAELFHKGLTIQLQDRLILSQNLSYNELASATIDKEGTMKACEAVKEKKRKRAVSGPSGGSSSGAPPKYHMIYTPPAGQPLRPLPQFWGNCPQQQQQQYNRALPAQQQRQQVAVRPP